MALIFTFTLTFTFVFTLILALALTLTLTLALAFAFAFTLNHQIRTHSQSHPPLHKSRTTQPNTVSALATSSTTPAVSTGDLTTAPPKRYYPSTRREPQNGENATLLVGEGARARL